MKNKKYTSLYLACDIIAALLAWILFFIFRKYNVNSELFSSYYLKNDLLADPKLYIGVLAYPFYWVVLHSFTGYYNKPLRKSRLQELELTFVLSLVGAVVFFFVFILDDIVNDYSDYTTYFLVLFCLQFVLTYLPRLFITSHINNKIHNGTFGFNTLLVGNDDTALATYESLTREKEHSGNFFIGYITIDGNAEDKLANVLPCMGELQNILEILEKHHIEELIVATTLPKHECTTEIINQLHEIHEKNVTVKFLPQSNDFLVGLVRTDSVLHEPMVTLSPHYLMDWQKHIKRFFDVLFSGIALILLSPLYLILAIGVKCSSPGPVFYAQERIGYKGKPFKIFKFRSMVADAETGVPQLSSKNDNRITSFGKFMRKTRLDETPQFFNVLRGDMSLVGPRPERQYYINQIVKVAPYYKLLQNVKPGITSWGQVKFGYAENVTEMVERLKWDILYLENFSIQMDIKILIYTVLIVLERKGK